MKIKATFIISWIIISTATIFIKILPTFKEKLRRVKAVFYIMKIMSFTIIFTQVWRMFLIWTQDYYKENNPPVFSNTILSYSILCEVLVYLFIIYELFW